MSSAEIVRKKQAVDPSASNNDTGFVSSVTICSIHTEYCCNHSVGVALNARFTTKGMYAKNNVHI